MQFALDPLLRGLPFVDSSFLFCRHPRDSLINELPVFELFPPLIVLLDALEVLRLVHHEHSELLLLLFLKRLFSFLYLHACLSLLVKSLQVSLDVSLSLLLARSLVVLDLLSPCLEVVFAQQLALDLRLFSLDCLVDLSLLLDEGAPVPLQLISCGFSLHNHHQRTLTVILLD